MMWFFSVCAFFIIAPKLGATDLIPDLPLDAAVTGSEIAEMNGSRVIERSAVKKDGSYLDTEVTIINTSNGYENHTFELKVHCGMKYIVLYVSTESNFTGLIYPKNANPSCMGKYATAAPSFTFRFPLKGCNTKHQLTENAIEYYNTLVFQPHVFLVTPDAKHFNLKCQYATHTQTLSTDFSVNYNESGTTDLFKNADPPRLFMEIYTGRLTSRTTAEEVIVGENVTLVVGMENYEMYSLRVSNCHVNSGMGDRHLLYDRSGCTVDGFVMGPLIYSEDLRFSFVTFSAHKFAFSDNVYYRCDIKFCVRKLNKCGPMPPKCDAGNPRGMPSEILSNEEFFKLFGGKNFTHRANYEDYSRFIRPQNYNNSRFFSKDGPILGGLTPDMIQRYFAEDEKKTSDFARHMRKVRSLRSHGYVDQDSVRYPLGLYPDEVYQVEFGFKVTEDGQKRTTRKAPDHEEIPKFAEHPFSKFICWSHVQRPLIITSIFIIPAFVFFVILGLQIHKCFETPDQPEHVERGNEMRNYASNPTVYFSPDPEIVEINEPYVDYRRRFRRYHSQPNIKEAVEESYSRSLRSRSSSHHRTVSSVDFHCQDEADDGGEVSGRNICVVGTPLYTDCHL